MKRFYWDSEVGSMVEDDAGPYVKFEELTDFGKGSNEPFQVGDVVFLKSGSPPLVVTGLPAHSNDGEIEKITVTWLDAEHEGRVIVLPAICFMKDNPGWPGIGLWPFTYSSAASR